MKFNKWTIALAATGVVYVFGLGAFRGIGVLGNYWLFTLLVTGVLIGMLVADGRLRLDETAPVPAWQRLWDQGWLRKSFLLLVLAAAAGGVRIS